MPRESFRRLWKVKGVIMSNIFAIIGGILSLIVAGLYGLFRSEKKKRIAAEEKTAEKVQEIVIKTVEAETVQAARDEEKTAAEKIADIDEAVKEAVDQIRAADPSEQTRIYNEKVRNWRKVTR